MRPTFALLEYCWNNKITRYLYDVENIGIFLFLKYINIFDVVNAVRLLAKTLRTIVNKTYTNARINVLLTHTSTLINVFYSFYTNNKRSLNRYCDRYNYIFFFHRRFVFKTLFVSLVRI